MLKPSRQQEEICRQIVEAYRAKGTQLATQGVEVLGRLYQTMSAGQEDSVGPVQIAALGLMAYSHMAEDCYREAVKYEKLLRSSVKLSLTHESELKDILKRLPIEHRTRYIPLPTISSV